MPKLLLIQPTQYSKDGGLCKQKIIRLPGLVFPLLAAMTPEQWEVEIKLEVVDDLTFEEDADLIGIGSMGHAIHRSLDIAKEYKKRGKTVFLGGYMASMVPEEVLKRGVDSVIVGDAEISYPKLLEDYEKKKKIDRIYDNPVKNFKDMPLPKYELLLDKPIGDMLPVQAARGCPHTCSFCSIAALYKGGYIPRPIDDVMRDILRIKELGFKGFYLIDDNIVGRPAYLKELVKRIKPLKMRWASQCTLNLARNEELLKEVAESGCKILSFGIESITQGSLDNLDKKWVNVNDHEALLKKIVKAGIMPSTEMIVGTDSDTEESIRETYNFIMRLKIAIPRFYVLTPIPNSELYRQMKAENRLIHEDYSKYDCAECVHYPKKISPEKLNEMYKWLNKKTFSLPSIIRRVILKKEAVQHPLIHLFALWVNLHYRKYTIKGNVPNIF